MDTERISALSRNLYTVIKNSEETESDEVLFVLSLLTYSFMRGADATEFETALSKTITDFEKNIRMIGDHNVNILN